MTLLFFTGNFTDGVLSLTPAITTFTGQPNQIVGTDAAGQLDAALIPFPVFGQNYQKEERTDEITVGNTATFLNYLTLTTPSLPIGEYLVGWFFVARRNNANNDFSARVQVDDVIDLIDPDNGGTMQVEHKDGGTNQRVPYSGFGTFTTTSAGTHTIDFDFRGQGAGTSFVFQCVLTIWRVV